MNHALRTLDLAYNGGGAEVGVVAGQALAVNDSLQALSLSRNRLGPGGTSSLAAAMHDSRHYPNPLRSSAFSLMLTLRHAPPCNPLFKLNRGSHARSGCATRRCRAWTSRHATSATVARSRAPTVPPHPPPPLGTNRTRRVLLPVLIGHAASFSPY
jgi:hypothetical protein